MSKERTIELRNKAKDIIQRAKEQSKKLIEEAEQLEAQNKLKIADKAIEFYKNNITDIELRKYIEEHA
ncbi:MAG: hypothetical protein WC667_04890 [Sulfurimonas sp.]|jgi:hypothetical protein